MSRKEAQRRYRDKLKAQGYKEHKVFLNPTLVKALQATAKRSEVSMHQWILSVLTKALIDGNSA